MLLIEFLMNAELLICKHGHHFNHFFKVVSLSENEFRRIKLGYIYFKRVRKVIWKGCVFF